MRDEYDQRRETLHLRVDVPLRIVVTGDTHLGLRRNWLPNSLTNGLTRADVILHTGDFSTMRAWELFKSQGTLLAVRGNNDAPDLAGRLPSVIQLEAGERSIIAVHGDRERGRNAREAVINAWAGAADIVVFGHSHQPYLGEAQGTTFLNPGSPTMKRREPRYSYAMLEIREDGSFDVEMIFFDKQFPDSSRQ